MLYRVQTTSSLICVKDSRHFKNACYLNFHNNYKLTMKTFLLKKLTICLSLIVVAILFYNFQYFSKTRIIKVGIVTYGGYAAGFYYNGGLNASKDSKFYKKHGLLVQLEIIDDYVASRKMFERGELDLLWTTFDTYSTEVNSLEKHNPKMIFATSKSNGADAIVVKRGIEKPSDLIGKTIAVSELTPSHSFLLDYLERHNISENQVVLQKYADAIATAGAFKAKKVDAAVVWSPDDEDCVRCISGSRILTTTKDFPNTIIDGFIAKQDYIDKHEKELLKLIRGWTDAAKLINENQEIKLETAKILEEAFNGFSIDMTYQAIENVHLCDLDDNKMLFGLRSTEKGEVSGKEVYQSFAKRYHELGYLEEAALDWEDVSNHKFIQYIN